VKWRRPSVPKQVASGGKTEDNQSARHVFHIFSLAAESPRLTSDKKSSDLRALNG
jgi:hypothetical protein